MQHAAALFFGAQHADAAGSCFFSAALLFPRTGIVSVFIFIIKFSPIKTAKKTNDAGLEEFLWSGAGITRVVALRLTTRFEHIAKLVGFNVTTVVKKLLEPFAAPLNP